MQIRSRHGATLTVIPGRTVLHYENGFLQNDTIDCESAYDARETAKRLTASKRHFLATNHRYEVA